MKIFNIGTLELLIILIIVFVLLGPEKAVQSIRDVGRWIRNVTKSPIWREILTASSEIRHLPKKIIDDIDLQRTIDVIDDSTREVNQALQDVQADTENKLAKLQREINQGLQFDLTENDFEAVKSEPNQPE